MALEMSQMLDEHQAADNTGSKSSSTYDPSEDESKSIKLAESLFEKAKKARKSYDEKWVDNYRMFRGRQWKDARPSYRHSEVINLIFRAIQSEIPMLTDAMPKPEFVPTEPNDYELSKILNDLLDSDWTQNNWAYNLTEILYDSHLYGTGFGCVKWDELKNYGEGGITFKSADPFYQFPDPFARDVNEECRYYVEAEPLPLELLKHEYPDVAKFLKPDVVEMGRKDKEINTQIRYKSPTDNRKIVEGTSAFDIENKDQAIKITAYIQDMTTVEQEEKSVGKDGQELVKYIKKLKYPKGRKVVVVSGVLCEDVEMEYDDNKFPYVKLNNYILPREFWGISEIEQLESPQKIFNKLISFTLDVLTLMGNPVWVVDTTSGVDCENLQNRPGLVIEKEPNSNVQRVEGVQLQPFVLQTIDRMKMWFDDISGSTDSSRGIRPEGVTAASAIEALQSASNTRLRQKSRNLDALLQNFGQMYLSRVFQYYTAPRVFRVTDNENAMKYFKFHVDSVMVDGIETKIARVRSYVQGEDDKYYLAPERQFELAQRFDVKIQTGSTLPFEKNRVSQESMNLFDRGIIDADEVLKNIKYPNADQVTKRMAEKAQASAQAQAGAPQPIPQGVLQ